MVGLFAAAWPAAAALPSDVILTKPVNLEILRNGKPGGTVALPAGEKLDSSTCKATSWWCGIAA